MEVLNHSVFILNVVLDSVKIVRCATEVLLLKIVRLFLFLLSNRKDVLYSVGHDKVFVRFESEDGPLICLRNALLLVSAVVGEVTN